MDSQGVDRDVVRQMIEEMGAELFLSKVEEDIAQEPIGFMKGLWIKAKELFGITEDGDAKLRNLDVDSLVRAADIQSPSYTGDGMADTGFRLVARDNTGSSKLTVDNLYVRKKATFEELEVRKETAIAGNQIYSGAANVVIRTEYYGVEDTTDPSAPIKLLGFSILKTPWLLKKVPFLLRGQFFGRTRKTRIYLDAEDIEKIRFVRCYFLAKDDEREVYNLWKVQEFREVNGLRVPVDGTGNDLARCQTMNLRNSKRPTYIRGFESKAGNVYWWRKLCGVSSEPAVLEDGRQYHFIDITFDYAKEEAYRQSGQLCPWCDLASGDIPAAGDHVVQFGNDMNPDRMNLIAVEVNSSGDAPAQKFYRGIYTFDLTKCWWGGSPRKAMLSPSSGYEFYGPNFKVITEYGIAPVPKDRTEVYWSQIALQRDDYGSHTNVRKCYYYDAISNNGSRYLCLNPEGVHWVRPQQWDNADYALFDANGNYRHNGNYISDVDYNNLDAAYKAQCGRVPNYTTIEPSTENQVWKMIVEKGESGHNSVRIDLDNENDTMLYSSSKGLVSGNVVSNAYLFDGTNDVSSEAVWSINATGCTATITNRVITVTAMSAPVGSVQVNALYNGVPYSAILSLKKITDADKYELIITPNSIAYNNSTDTPATSVLSIQVFKTACDGTRALSAPPSGYDVYAGTTKLTASSTGSYSYTTDNSAVNSVIVKIATSASSNDCLDAETIPINKTANGANGYTPRKGVDYFDGQNGKDGWMVQADPANVIITQNIRNTSSFTSATVSFSAKKGNVTANLVSVGAPTSSTFNVSNSGNTVVVSSPKTHASKYYDQGNFSVQVTFRDPDSSSNITFTMTILCYANLLGSWEEEVVADMKREVATAKFYFEDENGNVVAHETIGDYIKSSSENISKLEDKTASRNMLDCASGEGWKNWTTDNLATYDNTTQYIEGNNFAIDVYSTPVFLKSGVTYVISAFAAVTPIFKFFKLNGNPNAKVSDFSGNYAVTISVSQTSGTYQSCNRYCGTLTLGDAYGNDYYILDVYGSGLSYFYRPQIEVGSAPTDWQPSSIINSTSYIKQTAKQIEMKVNDTGVNINDGTINLYADKVRFFKNKASATAGDQAKVWIEGGDGSLHAVDGKFEGVVNASAMYSSVEDLTGESLCWDETNYRFDISRKLANTYIVYGLADPDTIVLPSPSDYIGMEICFYKVAPGTRVPTSANITTSGNKIISQDSIFSAVSSLRLSSFYTVVKSMIKSNTAFWFVIKE